MFLCSIESFFFIKIAKHLKNDENSEIISQIHSFDPKPNSVSTIVRLCGFSLYVVAVLHNTVISIIENNKLCIKNF